jgi:hypothetical protein
MLITLAEARALVARFVENGTCNATTIDARINEALSRITDMQDWECLRKLMRITVHGRAIGLPANVEKILWADVDGTPARVFGQPYQFLSSGPGDLDYRQHTTIFKDLVDAGDGWPTLYDIPRNLPLVAMSTASQDVGKQLQVRGVVDDVETTQLVPVVQWKQGIEGQLQGTIPGIVVNSPAMCSVSRVIKPTTHAPVSLFAVDPVSSEFFYLAKYSPLETVPQFRRYNLTNASDGNDYCILALARLRFVPLSDGDDVLPIDNPTALKLMIMAIREENAGNFQGSVSYEAKARLAMQSRESATTVSGGAPTIINVDYRTSLGRYLNRSPL